MEGHLGHNVYMGRRKGSQTWTVVAEAQPDLL